MDIQVIRRQMPDTEVINAVSELFKVLGDMTRVKILFVLEQGALCVGDIATCTGMTKYAISHQLRVLRQAKLVRSRREGKEVFYSLDDEHVFQIFDCALKHVQEE
ncbi:MAG: winged helix-turn-helix transcriptional regulator [Clostridia bacterium]|nr:winged helix-turn-helix transcriptional regulator [Clostridia bacterium]